MWKTCPLNQDASTPKGPLAVVKAQNSFDLRIMSLNSIYCKDGTAEVQMGASHMDFCGTGTVVHAIAILPSLAACLQVTDAGLSHTQ